MADEVGFERIDAVTLRTADMARSFAFYSSLGLPLRHGGPEAPFTTFAMGASWLNIQVGDAAAGAPETRWGRVIVFVDDVDAVYRRCLAMGAEPEAAPSNAPWGERYFHVRDPDGHELSFACPLDDGAPGDGGRRAPRGS